ncbi:MAG: hypothetical protein ACJA1L_002666 [Paracoccaceae bacterium]|jgi:hypothetical protein
MPWDWRRRLPVSVTERFVNLEILIGGYFHQDWNIERANDVEIILASRQAEPADLMEATVFEVEKLFRLCAGDPLKFDEFLASFGYR